MICNERTSPLLCSAYIYCTYYNTRRICLLTRPLPRCATRLRHCCTRSAPEGKAEQRPTSAAPGLAHTDDLLGRHITSPRSHTWADGSEGAHPSASIAVCMTCPDPDRRRQKSNHKYQLLVHGQCHCTRRLSTRPGWQRTCSRREAAKAPGHAHHYQRLGSLETHRVLAMGSPKPLLLCTA